MNSTRILLLFAVWSLNFATRADPLESGFANPPDQTKPWCYYYWISDNISKEGITRDLEAMARVGIGEVLIGNIFLDDVPAGKVKVLTPEWWELVEHAIREGGRTGVNIGMFNCPGWSQSGGPWIKPEQAMRYVVSSETRVTGPAKFSQKLPVPKEPFQDIAVLAFPAPQADAGAIAATSPRVTCFPPVNGAEKLADGDLATSVAIPAGKEPFTIEIETASPFTARSLAIHPAAEAFGAEVLLEAADAGGKWQTIRQFKFDRSNMSIGVGPMPHGPVTISFAPTTAKKFRLAFTGVFGRGKDAALAEVNLSGAARLEAFIEKQLGKMHPTPTPLWDTYMWPTPAEPDAAKLAVPVGEVRELSAKLDADGTLRWDVPPGDWIILRTGMTPTGMQNAPASPEGIGLEVDKMNRSLAQHHFDAFIGELLKRMPASERRAFKQVVADSYEMGSQNWTDGFGKEFQRRYGYDPKPWLPVLTGRIIGSADQSERFLWDLRRLVAERVATDYVGGLRAASQAAGLGLWLENYGHWGFPSEFLKYGSESDRIGGEFWVTGDLGAIELRAASSCVNTYGKNPIVSAEAFTGGPAFQNSPGALKARGDWAFCEGINHFVLHVYIHQPWADKIPGVNAWFGTEFNRHNTWFEQSKAWIEYLRRSCWLLQQGNRVADVAYFIGEDAPKMTGMRQPELPPGRDFDYINAEVIEKHLGVKDGVLTLPHGTTYRVLVLPKQSTMRPELLRKIRDLVKAGATIVGPPPSRSPSLEKFPECDEEVQQLAREVWGEPNPNSLGEHRFGKGRVVWSSFLGGVLTALGSKPDFESSTKLRFTHRRSVDADIYFVANPKAVTLTTTAAFRVGGKAPELWWPDSGRIERPAVYDEAEGVVQLPLSLGPQGSVFVVFRAPAAPKSDRIVSVTRNGEEILGTTVKPPVSEAISDRPNNFTFAVWVKPDDDTTLVGEANSGVAGLSEPRNDVFAAPHGDGFGGAGNAGSGLAVGRNGVCLFEHGANYFAPTLVYAGSLTNWTHVAVAYRDGQPSLYLNGVPVRKGLKSTHVVHSGAGQGGGAKYRGKLGAIEPFDRPLSETEIANLMTSMPRLGTDANELPPQLTRNADGKITAQVWQPGDYELKFADGQTRSLKVAAVARPVAITGPWEASFAPGWGMVEKVSFEQLTDWTKRSEDAIKYFSGPATYRKTFTWEPGNAQPSTFNPQLFLDLGEVRDLATVRVNGRELATLWLAPWRVDITSAVKPGANTLEIVVVNPWNNRLVGDAALPAEQRHTFLAGPKVSKNAPLLPAGLLGPVRLWTAETVELK
ncbi:MAG: glycosyl hydrolase [Verrucomicrobiota bacterium]